MPASLSSPSANGLPLKPGGSASVLSVSRPARRSLAFRPAWSLSRPWRPLTPECFRPFRCLHDPPWLLPTGATVVGRDSHPPEEDAFPRRTDLQGLFTLMHRMHRIWFWGVRRPVCPGIRKPAPDDHPGQFGLQQLPVLFILSIHVNHGQNIDPRAPVRRPPTDQSLPGGSVSAVPLQDGVIAPGSAGVPPAQDLAGSWRLASQGWSVHPPTDAGAAP